MNRTKTITACAIFLLALVSCDKFTFDATRMHSISCSIEKGGFSTKAQNVSDESELSYGTVQIAVFNSDGSFDTDGYATLVDGKFNMELEVHEGEDKEFHAVTNLPRITDITTKNDLLDYVMDLEENEVGSLVMTGSTTMDVKDETSVSIQVAHIVSKVVLKEIGVNFNDGSHDAVNVNAIYLINVNSQSKIGGGTWTAAAGDWFNKRTYATSAADDIIHESYSKAILSGQKDATAHTFYCCPNPTTTDSRSASGNFTPRLTRLVIDTDLGYYTIDLDVTGGLESNKKYVVSNVIIKTEGGVTPESETGKVQCTLTVLPFTSGSTIQEHI